MAEKMTVDEIRNALGALEGWSYLEGEDKIERKLELEDFDAAMAFINDVADVARSLDHHPELFNVYNQVRLQLTTHDANGVTSKDITFAQRANALL